MSFRQFFPFPFGCILTRGTATLHEHPDGVSSQLVLVGLFIDALWHNVGSEASGSQPFAKISLQSI